MKKKMLITGANGFVGFHLVNEALEAGFSVHAGVRKNSDINHPKNLNIQYSFLDYLDSLKEDFESKKYDFIVHAAGITKATDYITYERINADYTWNIAKAAKSINPQKIVFISSLAALGPAKYGLQNVLLADADPKPVTDYGKSKLLAEQYLKEFSELNWIILRPTAVYGPREKDLLLIIKTINKDKVSELVAENWHCSIEKAQNEISFSPQFNLEKGMKNTIEWYKINKWI